MTYSNAGASPDWPGMRTKAKGRQRLSAGRWILVVRPPRERPRAWWSGSPPRAPLAGPARVLVGTDDGGVDGDDPVEVAVSVGLGEQSGEHLHPGAVGGPIPQPVVDALPRPKRSGRSIRKVSVRHLNAIASIICR